MNKLITSLVLLLLSFSIFAQNSAQLESLKDHFLAYDIIEIDLQDQSEQLKDRHSFHKMKFSLAELGAITLELTPKKIFADDYVRREVGPFGERTSSIPEIYSFRGYVKGYNDSFVGLSISKNFINGSIRIGEDRFIIQNLYDFIDGINQNKLIIYNAKDGIVDHPAQCGAKHPHTHQQQIIGNSAKKSMDGECLETEIALAADWLMYDSYGSSNNVEDQIVGVLDDVQTNYDDEFADEIQYVVSELFIVTDPSDDPWTASTNPGTLLDDFRSWGNSGGFGGGYDVASLWTDRDFNGGVIGVAWLNAICNSLRYNVNQDFTSNANFLRVLQAHELGHNWGSGHDGSGSGFIMAPSVNNTNSWSANSINVIENFYSNLNCLDDCTDGSPPNADFFYDQDEECSTVEVQFFDNSDGPVTDYFWEFEGGNPETSTEQNPIVEYEYGGLFDVSLTATNIFGSDVYTENNEIDILDGTTADFDWDFMDPGNIVQFINFSESDVIDFYWDLGDGNISMLSDPLHTYEEDGEYYVELEVYNGECEDVIGFWIEIATPPTAAFDSDVVIGCVPLTVEFINLSSNNADDFLWEFEGGDPAFTGQYNPTVVYNTPGTYDVVLFVENETGTDEIIVEDYITVLPGPFADYVFTVDGFEVSFTNLSQNYTDASWNFGDGELSTLISPVHVYDQDGFYTVTLTVTGDCGIESYIQTVEITSQAGAVIGQSTENGCLPLTVEFDGSNSNLAETYEWIFEGATPGESNDDIVQVTYDEIGVYDVTLIVTNAFSDDTLMLENAVTVNDAPSAFYNSTNSDLDFTFESVPDGTFNTIYTWDFGDGISAEGENVNHSYLEEGIYEVNMTATNECGTSEFTETFNLYTAPAAAFSSSSVDGCVPFEVAFTNESSSNSENFIWSFPGGEPASSVEINPVVTYTTAGTYNVSLMVSNPAGENEVVEENFITVRDVPVAAFANQNDQLVVNFIDQSIDATSISWDFGDGFTSTENNPSHAYNAEGEYLVTLIATNDCGSDEISLTIQVTLKPTASFGVSVNSGCAPLMVTFEDASSSNVDSWSWEFPGGDPSTSTEQNPTITYNEPGSYDATLLVQGEGGEDMISVTGIVVAFGLPSTEIQSQSTMNEVEFSSTNTDVIEYDWDFGDGNTSTASNPTNIYAENGTYLVSLSITDECGTTTVESEVLINVFASAGFVADQVEGCPPFEVQFNQDAMNAENYQWSFPGGSPESSDLDNVTVIYNEPGTYPVSLLVGNSLGEDIVEVESFITVGMLPIASFEVSELEGDVSTMNSSENGTSYSWDFGDGSTSEDFAPGHNYGAPGTYTVSLTVSNECGSATESRDITIQDISEPFINQLEILPNPNDGNFNILIKATGLGDYDYFISDILDRSVSYGTITVRASQELYPISLPSFAPATYILTLTNDEQKITRKIVVQ